MWDQQRFSGADGQQDGFEHLRKQERIWFNWVCRLHDVHASSQTPQSAATLSIARRRWADARRALERAEARSSGENAEARSSGENQDRLAAN